MNVTKKMILAPMATLSHEAFRRSVEDFGGCDEYFTEMINATSLLNMGPFEKYYLMPGPCPEKIVWQLTGWETESMVEAAKVLASQEGTGLDINMGCSAPQIYKTGAGIAWMLKPLEETERLVRGIKSVLDEKERDSGKHMRLSVKCRLGDEKFTEESFFAFTDMLAENGVELITLHARTMKEKYRGLPRYSFVEKLKARHGEKIHVYLNGSIQDRASLDKALSQAPDCDGVMIAREAAVRPWIFRQLSKSPEERITVDREKVALDFIDNVTKYQPQEFHRTRIQRFFGYYCQQFQFGHYFATRMLNHASLEDAVFQVKDYFEKQESERFLEI